MAWNEVNQLILQAQMGDRTAYGQLVQRFHGAVYSLALSRLGDKHEAEELSQAVFVHAMKKLPQLQDPRCFMGWLRTITKRMASNVKPKRVQRTCSEPELLEQVASNGPEPSEIFDRNEQLAQLLACMKRLKPVDRATLEGFYIRGRDIKQLSQEFETPEGTVKRRLHVARLRLRALMEGKPAPRKPVKVKLLAV